MYVQFNISPVTRPAKKKIAVKPEEPDDLPVLSLAPFTPCPKIFFENVTVGTSVTRRLSIQNDSNCDLLVGITKFPPPERAVTFSWKDQIISAKSQICLDIIWTPSCAGGWRDTITIEGGKRLRKDVGIVFKSIPLKLMKKVKGKKQKSPTFVASKIKNRGTINGTSPIQKPFSNLSNIPFSTTDLPNRRDTFIVKNKENFKPGLKTLSSISYLEDNRNNKFSNSFGDNFDDSLEKNTGSDTFQVKLQSELFKFSPENSAMFKPKIERLSPNISTNTYTKERLSNDTYDLINLSTATYTKINSPCMEASRKLSNFSISPIPKDSRKYSELFEEHLETNAWCSEKALKPIMEETSFGYCEKRAHKRKSDFTFNTSSPKKSNMIPNILTWSKTSSRKARTETLNLKQFLSSTVEPKAEIKTELNPVILTATAHIDPFVSSAIYYDLDWIDQYENRFKNWLNALLTPPAELYTNVDGQQLDVLKLWQECKKKQVATAPTKEIVSNTYHTNQKLGLLKKTARNLFTSSELGKILTKVVGMIDSKKLHIRNDRNVHLDLGLQAHVLSLLLSYNPLWLRIGLETIYNTVIPLNSNSDVVGLTNFIMHHFFKDPYLLKKYKSTLSPKYGEEIKNFILKKFLFLVYFLDVAKNRKIIPYDPCLFCKNAPVKDNREILLSFSRELLSAIGDITRVLRSIGYSVTHKQVYIHEFDYGVINLGSDLRDGVRLTRVMEIILLRTNLLDHLRVPAVSRLQKIHNMKIVFESLKEANFEINGDILPKDIVDGHKEKTLSFLWQIIYKFEAPRLIQASITIQSWWRSFSVLLTRNRLKKQRRRRNNAATKIQRWYKTVLKKRNSNNLEMIVKIQSYIRMFQQRKRYISLRNTTICLQSHIRRKLAIQQCQEKLMAIIKIQAFTRMVLARNKFLRTKSLVIIIQQTFHAKKLMRIQKENYELLRCSAITIQKYYRAYRMAKIERDKFEQLKYCATVIQRYFRSKMLMKQEREKYLEIKTFAIIIQRHFRAYQQMKLARNMYQTLKNSAIIIQRRFRANQQMKLARNSYQTLMASVIVIQRRFRANQQMKTVRNSYQTLRNSAIVIQQSFRANQQMKMKRKSYQTLRKSAIIIQERFRANQQMKLARKSYQILRESAIVIQERFRANKQMKLERNSYQTLKNATVIIQKRFRAYQQMKIARHSYQILRKSAIVIQGRFRANEEMKLAINSYQTLRNLVIAIQRRFRANQQMKLERNSYQTLMNSAVNIQRRFRANQQMKLERNSYQTLRNSAVIIQRRFRANQQMKLERNSYQALRNSAVVIQIRFRANQQMKLERNSYQSLRNVVIVIQRRFRANRQMKLERNSYQTVRNSAAIIQRRFRANQQMKLERNSYQTLRNSAVNIQRRFRANQQMKLERNSYQTLRNVVIVIQRRFRANQEIKLAINSYQTLRNLVIAIQRIFRANQQMQLVRNSYHTLRNSAVIIQRRFRAHQHMKLSRDSYQSLRNAVITIQRRFRAYQKMKLQENEYQTRIKAAVKIQNWFRSTQRMHQTRHNYLKILNAVEVIQRRYRLWYMKKHSAVEARLIIKKFVKYIQGFIVRRKIKEKMACTNSSGFVELNRKLSATVKIQSYWRGYVTRKREHVKVTLIRQNLHAAHQNAVPENTLAYRRDQAMKLLVNENTTFLQLIFALEDLEFITRRCKETCMKLSKLLPQQLYIMITSFGRSLPEMQASMIGATILINIGKYHLTSSDIWAPAFLDKVITVMMHWCDKEGLLFPLLCTVIWLLAQKEEQKLAISKLPNLRQRFMKMETACLRKQKMVLKMNVNFKSVFCSSGKLVLPMLQPDWGLEYPDKPRTFTNSIHALNSLMNIFNIH